MSIEVTYQMALEKMVPSYKRWAKASDVYDEVSEKYPDNQSRIDRAFNREDRAYNILRAQTRLIGELFVKDEDEVWEDVENLSLRNGGE